MAKQSEAMEAELRSPNATWAEQVTEDARALTNAIHELKEGRLREIRRPIGNRPESQPKPTIGKQKRPSPD